MDYTLVWTEPAVADLEAILAELATRSSPGADALRAAILEHVELLQQFPEIGPVYDRDRSGRTREIICRGYRIFYQVHESEKQVEILTIRHGSRYGPRFS